MASISGNTMVMAIQAVAHKIAELEIETGDDTVQGVDDLQQLLMAYHKAAHELKNAYVVEARTVLNLPAYEDLVSD